MNTVYALVDPTNQEIRYVGATAHFTSRIRNHKTGHTSRNVSEWVKSLKANGLEPIAVVLEDGISSDLAKSTEERWINEIRGKGARLLNVHSNGKPSRLGPHSMKTLYVKDVPPDIHKAVKLKAIMAGETMDAVVIQILSGFFK